MDPLVTIVTPSYNQGRFIKETIESVLGQTYSKIEYWVIDGGSSDETLNLLREYEKRGVKWISQRDKGQSEALRRGFDLARGEIIGWINSDDILLPRTVEKAVHIFQCYDDIGFVYGDLDIIDETGTCLKRYRSGELTLDVLLNQEQSISQPGSFYRRSVVNTVGGIDSRLNFVMDYDLFIRMLKITRGFYLQEPVAKFRLHSHSKTYKFNSTLSVLEALMVSYRHGGKIISRLNARRAMALMKGIVKLILRKPQINMRHFIKK